MTTPSINAVQFPGHSPGGLRTRLQAVALLCVLVLAATLLLNAALGTAQADAVRAPGSEHEFHGFTKVHERNLAALADASQLRSQSASEAAAAPSQALMRAEGPAECVDGMAGQYPCDGVDLFSRLSLAELGLTFVNDIWGWTDTATGDDYALVGGVEGTTVVRITDPLQPVAVGILPTRVAGSDGLWRDIKVFDNHAYIVSEIPGHGMQVLDLSTLRDLDGSQLVTLPTLAVYNGIGSAHNIVINEDSGLAVAVGARDGSTGVVCGDGLHMISISDPASPAFAGCWNAGGYVHDAHCVTYVGPDVAHQGKDICVNSVANYQFRNVAGQSVFENTIAIVDVTDPATPIVLGSSQYGTGVGYSHQGWLTPDQSKFLHGDELDELFGAVATTTTRVWNLDDLDNPVLESEITNGNVAIDHNMYTRGDLAYQSNYTSGLRIRDLTGLGNGELGETAFFDVYPEVDDPSFDGGTWSNYPYYPREGLIAVSAMDRGLFLLGHNLELEEPFSCAADQGTLSWTDADQSKYWIYRSVDGGATYDWTGRTLGTTTFTDTQAAAGVRYQVHYQGIPRVECTILVDSPNPAVPAFACASNGGALSWTDADQLKYWIYRSTDGGATWQWIGRTLGATAKTDPQPAIGARYQVHYQGIPRVECEILSEPSAASLFTCMVDGAALTWTDADQLKYWIYRSVDGGVTYDWIGRTLGATTFTDRAPADGAMYQVHYQGIPRRNCQPLALG